MCDKIFQILPLYTKNITMSFAHQLVTLVPLAFGHINKCVKQLAKNSRGGVGGWGCCSACAQKQNNCDNDKHKQRKRIQTEYLPAPTHSPPPAQVNGTLAHALTHTHRIHTHTREKFYRLFLLTCAASSDSWPVFVVSFSVSRSLLLFRSAASNNIWGCVDVCRVVCPLHSWVVHMYVWMFVRIFGRRVYPIHVLLLRLLLPIRVDLFCGTLHISSSPRFSFSFPFPLPVSPPPSTEEQKLSRFMLRELCWNETDAHAHTDMHMPVVGLPKRKHKHFSPTCGALEATGGTLITLRYRRGGF